MSWQTEYKDECIKCGAVRQTELGDECPFSGEMCNGKNCKSKQYWAKAHKQPGYYRQRALDRTGLVEEYEAEVENG